MAFENWAAYIKMQDFRCIALRRAWAATCVVQLCAALHHLHELPPESLCTFPPYKMSSVNILNTQTHPDVIVSGYVWFEEKEKIQPSPFRKQIVLEPYSDLENTYWKFLVKIKSRCLFSPLQSLLYACIQISGVDRLNAYTVQVCDAFNIYKFKITFVFLSRLAAFWRNLSNTFR